MAITAYLYYSDVAASQKFLAKAFGFRKHGPTIRGSNGKIKHAAMKFGDDLVMMGCPGQKYKNPRNLGQATQCLLVNVEDIDEHLARAKKTEARIIQELSQTTFGQRRYGIEDSEGHQWFFSETKKSKGKT